MLSKVGHANAETHVPGNWNLVILHHTDCGMTDLAPYPDLLAEYFEIPTQQLPSKAVTVPIAYVRADVEVIMESPHGSDFLVSGLVYDVEQRTHRDRGRTRSTTHRIAG
jgi:carbonic anhydrase